MNDSTRESPQPGPSWYPPSPPPEPQSTVHPRVTQPQENKVAVSVRERIENWFIRPLDKFGSEDVFLCLMVCLPLLEKRVRYELMEAGENEQMAFSRVRARSELPQGFSKFPMSPPCNRCGPPLETDCSIVAWSEGS